LSSGERRRRVGYAGVATFHGVPGDFEARGARNFANHFGDHTNEHRDPKRAQAEERASVRFDGSRFVIRRIEGFVHLAYGFQVKAVQPVTKRCALLQPLSAPLQSVVDLCDLLIPPWSASARLVEIPANFEVFPKSSQ